MSKDFTNMPPLVEKEEEKLCDCCRNAKARGCLAAHEFKHNVYKMLDDEVTKKAELTIHHKTIFDPNPDSEDAKSVLGGFKISSRVIVLAPTNSCDNWISEDRKEVRVVCRVVRIFLDTKKLCVSPDKAEYKNVKLADIRLATDEEIRLDLECRKKRQMRWSALIFRD
jgi:hypothetical protein